MGDVFNTSGGGGGFGDVFNTGVGKRGTFNGYAMAGAILAPWLFSNIIAPTLGNVLGGAYESIAGTTVGVGGANIGTIGSIGNTISQGAAAIAQPFAPAIAAYGPDLANAATIAPILAATQVPANPAPAPAPEPPAPVAPKPPAPVAPKPPEASTPTPAPGPAPIAEPPAAVTDPTAAPNLADSRYANDPTAQFSEAVKRRRLAMLRRGMLDTVKTGPGGLSGAPSLLIPAAAGGGLKTKLGA